MTLCWEFIQISGVTPVENSTESELLYDRRFTTNQFVLAPSPLRLTARIFFFQLNTWGHGLWRENGSVIYNCCWPSPAHSFSGPSPVGLATIFNCLRFETSLFVASYHSQGYGGGIWPRLHMGNFNRNTRHSLHKLSKLPTIPPLLFSSPTCYKWCGEADVQRQLPRIIAQIVSRKPSPLNSTLHFI
jgi:hypothetical protein